MNAWFAHPEMLWLAPLLAMVGFVVLWGWRRRRLAMAALGMPVALRKLVSLDRLQGVRRICLAAGLILLVLGSAGPQWGRDLQRETRPTQDLVLVLDVSRSMLAEQPNRLQRATRALHDLADHLQRRGGVRVALIVFATQPQVVFPLTQDYDHLRSSLVQIERDDLPAGLRPREGDPPPSGTRIGAALRLAVRSRDDKHTGKSFLLLLSDGDDPARDDEWLEGVHDARAAQLPIHTIGVGDPHQPSNILLEGEPLLHEGKLVLTKLEENVLQEIARRTGGAYVPAHNNTLPLGSLFNEMVRRGAEEDVKGSHSTIPGLQQRHGWFLAPALACLVATLLLHARIKRPTPAVAGMLLVVTLVGAADIDEDLVRAGNAAFHRGELDEARRLFEKAALPASDPGLVSFNLAATLYRQGQYRAAELHYARCLEDDQAPSKRRAQAYFGLGNSLLRQAEDKDRAMLERAIDALAACLATPDVDPQLATDAQFNLELARWLHLRAQPAPRQPNGANHPDPAPPEKSIKKGPGKEDGGTKSTTSRTGPEDPSKKNEPGNGGEKSKERTKAASTGALHMIPDAGNLVPLPAQDTTAYLEQLAQRILQERRAHQRRGQTAPAHVKDW